MDQKVFSGLPVSAIEASATVATYGFSIRRRQCGRLTHEVAVQTAEEMSRLMRCPTLLHRHPDGVFTMELCASNGDGLILKWTGEKWEMVRLFTTDLDISRGESESDTPDSESEGETPAFMTGLPVELD